MTKQNLNIILKLTSFISVVFLINILLKQPTFLLGSFYLAIMIFSFIIIGSLIIGLILKTIFKRYNIKSYFFFALTILSIIGIFYLHKPTYEIIVPENYIGEVHLILSNVKENQLILDENGIGYINKTTFENTFYPKIIQNGKEIKERVIGFNPSTFWGISKISFKDMKIKSLTFEIVPKGKIGEKQYYHTELNKFVNKQLLINE